MKLSYFAETDTLYAERATGEALDGAEITDGIVAEFDRDGRLLGLEIDHASTRLDVARLETVGLPIATLLAA